MNLAPCIELAQQHFARARALREQYIAIKAFRHFALVSCYHIIVSY